MNTGVVVVGSTHVRVGSIYGEGFIVVSPRRAELLGGDEFVEVLGIKQEEYGYRFLCRRHGVEAPCVFSQDVIPESALYSV